MALTNERAAKLADFLKEDVERANKLVDMSPEDAAKFINEAGYDFTVEEVVEFGENLKVAAAQAGELSEDNLDEVAGGLAAAAAGVYLTCISIGITLGMGAGKNWKW